jgi:hypothetical protein
MGVSVPVALTLWTTPRRDAKDPAERTALEEAMERGAH